MASFRDNVTDFMPDFYSKQPLGHPLGLFVLDGRSVPLQKRTIKATVHPEGFCETTEELAFVSNEDVRQAHNSIIGAYPEGSGFDSPFISRSSSFAVLPLDSLCHLALPSTSLRPALVTAPLYLR
jgi:hypothetical protein